MKEASIFASLETFAKTGELGPIKVGLPRELLTELLGEPTDRLNGSMVTLKYGDIEFLSIWRIAFNGFTVTISMRRGAEVRLRSIPGLFATDCLSQISRAH